jgi:hypothetical protein
MNSFSIAIIGSFRQHYSSVLKAWKIFTSNEIIITSPLGAGIVEENIPFVRFETDSLNLDDFAIQSLALHRIFSADLSYAVIPSGYIGRTTCYEIGRLIQARRPIYFSDPPMDLPVRIPNQFILTPEELVKKIKFPNWQPSWLYDELHYPYDSLERELLNGIYRND